MVRWERVGIPTRDSSPAVPGSAGREGAAGLGGALGEQQQI